MKIEHILVIRFSAMGDVAMTVPVVYSAAKQYPNVRFTVLSKPYAKVFFEDLAPNIGFMEADINDEYHGIKGLNTLYRRLTAKNFSGIADLHNVLRSVFLRIRFNMGRFKVSHVDKQRSSRRELISAKNKVLKPLPAMFSNYAKVFENLGYPVKLEFDSIFLNRDIHSYPLPREIGDHPEKTAWIGIAPFAKHKGKTYPLPLMEKVIKQLNEKHPTVRIFLFGGKTEWKKLNAIAEGYDNCINASALLKDLKEELVLMSRLNLMVTMDSANMHLASLVGTKVISIWGQTHPYAGFMGWNQTETNAVQVDLPCRPCSIFGNKGCMRKDYACLNMIQPSMITSKIEENLYGLLSSTD